MCSARLQGSPEASSLPRGLSEKDTYFGRRATSSHVNKAYRTVSAFKTLKPQCVSKIINEDYFPSIEG